MELLTALLGFENTSEMEAWNDAPERTHVEVLERLDEAIRRLSEGSTSIQKENV